MQPQMVLCVDSLHLLIDLGATSSRSRLASYQLRQPTTRPAGFELC